jgi:hypothetical protein
MSGEAVGVGQARFSPATPCTHTSFDRCTARRNDVRMARTVVTQMTDDLDGSKDAEEVRFALQGVEYTIDLSKKNRAAFEKLLNPYIEAGTKVTSRRNSRRTTSGTASARRDLRAVRAWAKAQGLDVSDRGRVPASVLEQYDNR